MPPVLQPPSSLKTRLAALGVGLAGLVGLAGCGASEGPDVDRGRALFIEKCGTCHALTEAATTATTGPNLDSAFLASRQAGMDSDTIKGVVLRQIAVPRSVEEGDPDYQRVFMPANIVTGQDAEDVAAYVASVAGVEGVEPPEAPGGPGGQVFANNGCGACHTLAAAGASGTVGPNLDETLPGQTAAEVRESILNPNAKIVPGYPADTMPSYEGQITGRDLQLLVKFLLESAGSDQ
jgi:mono/diheme cytochrome c family protein